MASCPRSWSHPAILKGGGACYGDSTSEIWEVRSMFMKDWGTLGGNVAASSAWLYHSSISGPAADVTLSFALLCYVHSYIPASHFQDILAEILFSWAAFLFFNNEAHQTAASYHFSVSMVHQLIFFPESISKHLRNMPRFHRDFIFQIWLLNYL